MKGFDGQTTYKPKSLFLISQETLIKNLDALYEIGSVPFELIKDSLKHATGEQLQRIEKCNPKIKQHTTEFWLAQCLLFSDIKNEYENMGLHRDPEKWRTLYSKRIEENKLRTQSGKQRIREKYNILNNEKAAKSIKVIKGAIPTGSRSYSDARRSNASPLFQKSRKETDKVVSIYNTTQRRPQPYPSLARPKQPVSRSTSTPSTFRPVPSLPSRPTSNTNTNTNITARPNTTITTSNTMQTNTSRPNIARPVKSQSDSKRPSVISHSRNNNVSTANHVQSSFLRPSAPVQYSRTLPVSSSTTTTTTTTSVTKPPRPTQYLRTLPTPSRYPPSPSPHPPNNDRHQKLYKVNTTYPQPYNSPPISPPFSPERSNSPEKRPNKKQKMHL